MARIGGIIDDKYEVLREIGRGGMSVVYLAMDKRLNKQWAIKEFRKDKDDANKQIALKALLDEANLMKKLDHPTLPRIVDIIENNQTVYVIMDYIEGESLNKVLDAYGAQLQEAVIEWAKQLSDVLDYLHTQNPPIIYRDMKPANIMLKPDGTVRLIDFGIAREYKEGKEGDTEAIGTRGYAAPEQFGGQGQTDARTDIYSLGVTLYHLVTGKNPAEPPYEIYPIRHWNPSLSSGLEWLIQKCTQLNPGDRYQSCAEVMYVLENLEKFDVAYKKKQKSRINLFIISLVLTAVFAIASVSLFVGGAAAKRNTYDSLVAEEQYESAIEVDETRSDAYLKFSADLSETVERIITQSEPNDVLPQGTITLRELDDWFSYNRMKYVRDNDLNTYIKIQFNLGYLLWNEYDEQHDLVMKTVMPYFKRVIEACNTDGVEDFSALTAKQYNMTKVFYRVSFFECNRDKLTEGVAGEKKSLSDMERLAGIDVDAFEDSPYLSFWNTIDETLKFVGDDSNELTYAARLITMERISYILAEHHPSFYDPIEGGKVSLEQMRAFITKFEETLDSVTDEKEESLAIRNKIVDEMNRTIELINGLYEVFNTDKEIGEIG